MDLPIDILSVIFSFGNTQSLVLLLRTSRLFKTLAEPLLYRHIFFSALNNRGHLSRPRKFKQRIDENPHLATYVVSFTTRVSDEIAIILPILINLRRLKVDGVINKMHRLPFDEYFSPSARLTHLCWPHIDGSDAPAFRRFLESQPSLERLEIFGVFSKPGEFTLRPDSLPRLHTLRSDVPTAMSILPGRTIHNLELYGAQRLIDVPTRQSFPSVRTFLSHGESGESAAMPAIARLFPNLKYLYFQQFDDYDAECLWDDIVSFLRAFAASKVEYISLDFNTDFMVFQDIPAHPFATCFKELHSLRTLDIGLYGASSSSVFRYHAADPLPKDIDLPHPDFESWDLWWEHRNL